LIIENGKWRMENGKWRMHNSRSELTCVRILYLVDKD